MVVVTDLPRCNPATRAWCLREWGAALRHGGADALHLMRVGPAQAQALATAVDVVSAKAAVGADAKAARDEAMKMCGTTGVFDSMVKLTLVLRPISYRVDLEHLNRRARSTKWRFEPLEVWGALGGGKGEKGRGTEIWRTSTGAVDQVQFEPLEV
eukprot:353728-Chlamydomonas_euryale.AAC.1